MNKFALWLLVCSTVSVLPAAPVYGTSASTSGNFSLVGFGNWTTVTLAWNIVPNAGNSALWDYSYTLTNTGSNLSHVVLEFSASCAGDPACITNANHNPDGPRTYADGAPPNFELPVDIFGVKFDGFSSSPNTFHFTSNRAPVWGDVYARDGGKGYAFNSGITNHNSSNVNDFIARPDGSGSNVPEPGTFAICGIALVLLAFFRRIA